MIIPIFGYPGWVSAVLAHDPAHCVPGITLPPGDANPSFHCFGGLAPWSEEENLMHMSFPA